MFWLILVRRIWSRCFLDNVEVDGVSVERGGIIVMGNETRGERMEGVNNVNHLHCGRFLYDRINSK